MMSSRNSNIPSSCSVWAFGFSIAICSTSPYEHNIFKPVKAGPCESVTINNNNSNLIKSLIVIPASIPEEWEIYYGLGQFHILSVKLQLHGTTLSSHLNGKQNCCPCKQFWTPQTGCLGPPRIHHHAVIWTQHSHHRSPILGTHSSVIIALYKYFIQTWCLHDMLVRSVQCFSLLTQALYFKLPTRVSFSQL